MDVEEIQIEISKYMDGDDIKKAFPGLEVEYFWEMLFKRDFLFHVQIKHDFRKHYFRLQELKTVSLRCEFQIQEEWLEYLCTLPVKGRDRILIRGDHSFPKHYLLCQGFSAFKNRDLTREYLFYEKGTIVSKRMETFYHMIISQLLDGRWIIKQCCIDFFRKIGINPSPGKITDAIINVITWGDNFLFEQMSEKQTLHDSDILFHLSKQTSGSFSDLYTSVIY